MATPVDENLVQHEIAHVIHEQRHKGQNYYCASDADIAVAVLDLFDSKDWGVIQIPGTKGIPRPRPEST